MFKILYIVPNAMEIGGVQKILADKANLWVADNNDVMILVTNAHGNLYFDYHQKVKFEIKSLNSKGIKYFLDYKKTVEQAIDVFKPTHVFVLDNGLKGLLVPYFNLQKAICIYERHGEILVEQKTKPASLLQNIHNFFLKQIYQKLSYAFDAIVVLNESSKMEWKHSKLFVIPNFISFINAQQSSLDSKIVLFVARYQPEKGFDFLFKTASEINNNVHEWTFKIYTDQPEIVKQKAQEMGLYPNKNLEIFGVIAKLEEVYQQGSLLISTSKSEGFSLVLAEAMSFGIPCLAFDCDFGPRHIIHNNENGFLIPNFDVDMMVHKTRLLMENDTLRKQMGQKAMETSKRYQPEKIMFQWKKLLNEIREK